MERINEGLGAHSRQAILVVAACIGVSGCGGGSSPTQVSATTTPTRTVTFEIRGGLSGTSISGATASMSGVSCTTNVSGNCAVTAPSGVITISASGYLERRTSLGPDAVARLSLWPQSTPEGIASTTTQELFYTAWPLGGCCPGTSPLGGVSLARLSSAAAIVDVSLASNIRTNAMVASLRAAVDAMTSLTGGQPEFRYVDGSTSTYRILVSADAVRAPTGVAIVSQFSGRDITSTEVIYPSEADLNRSRADEYTQNLMHMLAHALGLAHTNAPGFVMGPVTGLPANQRTFAPAESQYWRLAQQRRSGNRYPDDDTTLAAATTSTATQVCARSPR
jgi:hypothetical protein